MKHERPIRVLQIIDSLGMGGAETWLMELLRLWSKTKFATSTFWPQAAIPGSLTRRRGDWVRRSTMHVTDATTFRDSQGNSAGCSGRGSTMPSTITRTMPADGIS